MARIEYVKGVKCNKCGKMLPISKLRWNLICQTCGADLTGMYGEIVTIKVTHKFFKNIYEEVK